MIRVIIIIFYPICFVEKPLHGIVMGVTMHYIQYLALTHKVTKKRKETNNYSGSTFPFPQRNTTY